MNPLSVIVLAALCFATSHAGCSNTPSSGVCMGYNIKCWRTSLANCKATCTRTAGCKMVEYSSGKTCCTSKYDSKANCPGKFARSGAWKGYLCSSGNPSGPIGPIGSSGSSKCGTQASGVCMGYNMKCWRTSLTNCKATCAKTTGCKMAEYSNGGTCCTSKYDSKANCPGSFAKSSSWKGYRVCAGSVVEPTPAVGTGSHACGTQSSGVCMGYNIKCWRTSLTNCKATCAKTNGCKMAEYSSGGTCCTSKYDSKANCPGTFSKSGAWKGYIVCGGRPTRPVRTRPHRTPPHWTTHENSAGCGSKASGVCMGYNIKCMRTSLANCKATCAKTRGCKMAEYSTGGTCCTSKYDSKANCPGTFSKSASWKGYRVCGGRTTRPVRTRPHWTTPHKNGGGCDEPSKGVCMGHNIKCFRTSLANCKAQCKKTNGCKMAEYSTGGTCCTSKYSSERDCPGKFETSRSWKGYYICHGTPSNPSKVNYRKAYQAFDNVDRDHSGSISYGGAYHALSTLFPNTSEEELDRLTKNADSDHYDANKHKYVFKDGKIDKQEFITIYVGVLARDAMQKAGCGRHHSCELCLAKSQSSSFGQLCAWSSSFGSGRCKPNIPTDSLGFGVLITKAGQCHSDVVHVHG